MSIDIRPLVAPVSNLPKWRPDVPIIDEPPSRQKWVLYGFILIFIGVAIGLVGKMLLHQDIITVVGVLASLAGMFLTAYPYLSPVRPQRYDVNPDAQPQALAPVQPTKKLAPMDDIDFVPSVTEGTTELLETPASRGQD